MQAGRAWKAAVVTLWTGRTFRFAPAACRQGRDARVKEASDPAGPTRGLTCSARSHAKSHWPQLTLQREALSPLRGRAVVDGTVTAHLAVRPHDAAPVEARWPLWVTRCTLCPRQDFRSRPGPGVAQNQNILKTGHSRCQGEEQLGGTQVEEGPNNRNGALTGRLAGVVSILLCPPRPRPPQPRC